MRIALINPGRLRKWAGSEPLNLGYIASYMEAGGHVVRIVDQLAGAQVERELLEFKPDIAGLTATTPLAGDAFEIGRFLKKQGVLTVMGGAHASSLPDDALSRGIDIVARGYGETAMAAIVDKGITSGIVDGEPPRQLDDLPRPARHLMRMGFYLKTPRFVPNYLFVPRGQKSARLITSRGCAYRCVYCHNSLHPTRLAYHSPERVCDEIRELVQKYDTRHFFFMDDNFLVLRKRVEAICALMLKDNLNIQWSVQGTANETDPDSLALLHRAGCRQILFGFESGSQRILETLQKKTTAERNELALRRAKEAGMLTLCYFIVGSPGETEDDLERTKRFISSNRQYMDVVLTSYMTPFPGTKLWEELKQLKVLPPLEQIDWSMLEYDNISPFLLNCQVNPKVLRRFYFEFLSLIPPRLDILIARFLSDPLGVMASAMRGGALKAMAATAWGSIAQRLGPHDRRAGR